MAVNALNPSVGLSHQGLEVLRLSLLRGNPFDRIVRLDRADEAMNVRPAPTEASPSSRDLVLETS